MGFFRRFRKPKAQLKIYYKKEWVLGDELLAVLRVTSQEEFDVEEIGVWLKCLEEVKKFRYYQETVKVEDVNHYGDSKPREESFWREEEYWDSEILFSNGVQVKGQMKINIDFDQRYPFTIKLPLTGRETYLRIIFGAGLA